MLKKTTRFLIFAIFLFFVVSRLFFFKLSFLEKLSTPIAYPALCIANSISQPIKKLLLNRRNHKELITYCKKLEDEQKTLLQENIKLKAMLHYNKLSKELVEFKNRYNLENAIIAKILVKTLTKEEHTAIINKGTRHGIEKNMAAVYKFQLIGKVSEAFPFYSKIILITDSQSKISAYTNTSNATGIVHGNNTVNQCTLNYVSHLSKITENDLIFSSGQGLVFPEGFCLGKIIHFKTANICHHVELEPLIDFKTLDFCLLTNQSKMNLF